MAPETDEKTRVNALHVTVLGAGLMGYAIASAFARSGADVRLFDPVDGARGRAAEAAVRDHVSMTCTDKLPYAIEGSHLIIEAAPETLEAKSALLREVSTRNSTAVIATNTSGFRITDLAEYVVDPTRFVGTHFFNPADVVPLVEVIGGGATDDDVVTWTIDVLESAGKRPVRVQRDVPGFIANRLQHALWREALALIDAGVCTAETLDRVVIESFGPRLGVMGPMENADYIGLDLLANVQRQLVPHLANTPGVSPVLSRLVASGALGRKTGAGLTAWPSGRAEEADARLRSHLVGK